MLSVRLVVYSALVLIGALLFNFSTDTDILLAEKHVLLSKSLQETFDVVANLEKLPEWYPGIAGYMEVESGPKTKGKRYRETVNIPGIGNLYYVHTLLAYDPPRTIEFVDDSWLGLRYKLLLSESEPHHSHPRTMLIIKVTSGVRAYWFQYVAVPIFKFLYDQRLRTAGFNVRFLVDSY